MVNGVIYATVGTRRSVATIDAKTGGTPLVALHP